MAWSAPRLGQRLRRAWSTSPSCGNPLVTSGGPFCGRKCGDGVVQVGEQCDDGNKTNGDGCDNTCQSEGKLSCKAILATNPSASSGLYYIDPDGTGPIAPYATYCDMFTDGGGWTLVAHANNGVLAGKLTGDSRVGAAVARYFGQQELGGTGQDRDGNRLQLGDRGAKQRFGRRLRLRHQTSVGWRHYLGWHGRRRRPFDLYASAFRKRGGHLPQGHLRTARHDVHAKRRLGHLFRQRLRRCSQRGAEQFLRLGCRSAALQGVLLEAHRRPHAAARAGSTRRAAQAISPCRKRPPFGLGSCEPANNCLCSVTVQLQGQLTAMLACAALGLRHTSWAVG